MNVHRANYVSLIERQVADLMDDRELSEPQAFTHLAASWLGFELDDNHITDGKADRGVDFWVQNESGFEFFQVKSHELTDSGGLQTHRFDVSGVNDLRRIRELLSEEEPPSKANRKVQRLVREWNMALAKKRMTSEPEELEATLLLVLFGDGLTEAAAAEFESLSRIDSPSGSDVPIQIRVRLVTLDNLLENRWRQDNRDWRDKAGKKRNTIDLHPEVRSGEATWIPGHNSAVFYCRAIDLIQAFEEFGYQVFEPNVRANIRRSRVNAAIRKSLSHRQSRSEFRFLNNGVTITCKSFSSPKANRLGFRVIEPGVVNGLQTVVAMHQEYSDLAQEEKKHLEENCFVLVRLLTENAVGDIGRVVLATNTQNPMQARNLRSNEEEQILYERLFAELGWFYERKQGAWDAFREDPARWRTLSNFRKKHFIGATSGQGRGRQRRVDNEEIAQTWLSLLGFSYEAIHSKRFLFEDDDLYQLIFLSRTRDHGHDVDFRAERSRKNSVTEAPAPQLMLASYLTRDLARKVPLSARDARESAIERLNLDRREPREVIDAELSKDYEFVRTRALSGMSFLFCDFFGYILFKAFGERIHGIGEAILRTPSFASGVQTGSMEAAATLIRKDEVKRSDVLAVAWFTFDHIIDELLSGAWRESYNSAAVKSRFLHDKDTRRRITRAFDELEAYMVRSQLTRAWAADIPTGSGVCDYFRLQIGPSNMGSPE